MKISTTTLQQRILLIAIVAIIFIGLIGYMQRDSLRRHQEGVRVSGFEVMPFDLDKTTHIFERRDNGGTQQVVVKDSNDQQNIFLIQQHLQEEATNFQNGDYSDPAFIHGMNMAGLSDLSAAADEITITYTSLPNGAQITYVSQDPQVVNAIHAWFMAQTMDHGNDAVMH